MRPAAGFIAGQLPTSQFRGPYLPAVIGALTCLGSLLLFLPVWTPQPPALLITAYLRPSRRQLTRAFRHAGPPRGQHHPLQPRLDLRAVRGYVLLIAVLFALFLPRVMGM